MSTRILPVLAIVLSIVIFFVYVRPLWTGPIAATKTAIANNNEALAAAERYKAAENKLAAERAAIDQSSLDRLSVFLPDSVDNVRAILDLNALAARSQLALTSISVDTSSTATTQQTGGTLPTSSKTKVTNSVDLSLTVVGTYSAFQNFLTNIEKSARFLDVRDITIKSSDTGVHTYKMMLRLYWLR